MYISKHQPRGVGIYTMALERAVQGTPEQAARRLASAGVSFVALLACWQEDGRHGPANVEDLRTYGPAFAEAGIDVWVWGYPWGTPECVTRFVQRMREAALDAQAVGVLLDPELGFKGAGAPFMRDLVEQTVDSLDESLGLGVTSYGLTSAHRDFPWAQCAGYGWGSPQLYTVPLATAQRAIEQWREFGWQHIVPSVPTFGPNSEARLAAYAGAIAGMSDGLAFWQWKGTSREEWRAIEACARMFADVPPERSVA